jgi:L-ascorbate metabolism protein UlaG (beta-lactamase superfamily)
MKRWLLRATVLLVVMLTIAFFAVRSIMNETEFGGQIDAIHLEQLSQSDQHNGAHFHNTPEPVPYSIWTNLKDMMGGQNRVPPGPFPALAPDVSGPAHDGLRVIWLGHATALIELEGKRILTDPMLTQHAFPVTSIAPSRFNPSPLPLQQLPTIDIAVISHDHYDHLDMKTVQHLAASGTHFYVGLGVGTHLQAWQVPAEQIHELDWWEQQSLHGLQIHCTPARHYSGRRSMDNSTLWSSWLIKGAKHSVYHSGDSGHGQHFEEIGQRLGAIDIALIKIGDYGLDLGWQDIHMLPERSIQAHQELGASVLFPIHWGTFKLSNHDWDEPIERAVAAADKAGVTIVTPKLGEAVVFGEPFVSEPWWQRLAQ